MDYALSRAVREQNKILVQLFSENIYEFNTNILRNIREYMYTFFYKQPGCLGVRPQNWQKIKQHAKQLEASNFFISVIVFEHFNKKSPAALVFKCNCKI